MLRILILSQLFVLQAFCGWITVRGGDGKSLARSLLVHDSPSATLRRLGHESSSRRVETRRSQPIGITVQIERDFAEYLGRCEHVRVYEEGSEGCSACPALSEALVKNALSPSVTRLGMAEYVIPSRPPRDSSTYVFFAGQDCPFPDFRKAAADYRERLAALLGGGAPRYEAVDGIAADLLRRRVERSVNEYWNEDRVLGFVHGEFWRDYKDESSAREKKDRLLRAVKSDILCAFDYPEVAGRCLDVVVSDTPKKRRFAVGRGFSMGVGKFPLGREMLFYGGGDRRLLATVKVKFGGHFLANKNDPDRCEAESGFMPYLMDWLVEEAGRNSGGGRYEGEFAFERTRRPSALRTILVGTDWKSEGKLTMRTVE